MNVLPDRVLDDVLAQLPVTPQRRPWWRAWRTRSDEQHTEICRGRCGRVLVVAAVALAVYFSRPAVGPAADADARSVAVGHGRAPTQPAVFAGHRFADDRPLTTQPTQTGSQGAVGRVHCVATWPALAPQTICGRCVLTDPTRTRSCPDSAFRTSPGRRTGAVYWSRTAMRRGISHVYLAEVSDDIGPFVDTGFGTGADTACHEKSREPFPCQDWRSVLRRTGSVSCFSKQSMRPVGPIYLARLRFPHDPRSENGRADRAERDAAARIRSRTCT